jgi:hypothetical protein
MSLIPYMPYEPTEVPMEVAVLFTTVVTILSILVNAVPQKRDAPVLLLDAEAQTEEQQSPPAPKRDPIRIPLRSPPKLHASIMSSNPLDEQILSVLATSPKPMTVRDIGKILYRHKNDINKRIYYMKQCKIVGMEGSTRLWALA